MSNIRPYDSTRDAQYVFAKTFVQDLDAMASFYEEVFGLVPNNRHQDEMLGRKVDEITYKATSEGGPALTLIKYLDSTEATVGEAVQGFVTTDIEGLVERAAAAGGRIPDPIRRIEEFGIRVVFVLDPEGHVNEVIQMDG